MLDEHGVRSEELTELKSSPSVAVPCRGSCLPRAQRPARRLMGGELQGDPVEARRVLLAEALDQGLELTRGSHLSLLSLLLDGVSLAADSAPRRRRLNGAVSSLTELEPHTAILRDNPEKAKLWGDPTDLLRASSPLHTAFLCERHSAPMRTMHPA
jgi:hypothetical protein